MNARTLQFSSDLARSLAFFKPSHGAEIDRVAAKVPSPATPPRQGRACGFETAFGLPPIKRGNGRSIVSSTSSRIQ